MNHQKIISLQSENVKRLVAVAIEPNGDPVTIIGGTNGSGKTSLLDSIEWCLGGKGSIQGKPIRDGQTEARTVIELDDIIVTRVYTEGSSKLLVTSKDGARYSSPQSMLDKLVGDLSFDPLEFTRLKPDARADLLRRLGGIKTAELEYEREKAFTERTDVNREAKRADAVVASLPYHSEIGDAPPKSIEELMAAIEEVEQGNEAIRAIQEKRVKEQQRLESIAENYERIDRDIQHCAVRMTDVEQATEARVQELLAEIEQEKAKCASRIVEIEAEREGLLEEKKNASALLTSASKSIKQQAPIEPLRDASELRQQVKEASSVNEKARQNAERAKAKVAADELAAKADGLTKKIKDLDKQIAEVFASAKFRVEGLRMTSDGKVMYQDIPFEQCSSAEQLRISTAMGMEMNPELRILLIRDGSLMDENSVAMVAEMAKEKGFQVFMEKVCSDASECTVLIENGEVKIG